MDRKIEVVEWIDPYSDDIEWTEISKIKVDMPTIYSVGHVVKETESSLVIAHSVGRMSQAKESECCGMMIIPKHAIKRRRRVDGLLKQKKSR